MYSCSLQLDVTGGVLVEFCSEFVRLSGSETGGFEVAAPVMVEAKTESVDMASVELAEVEMVGREAKFVGGSRSGVSTSDVGSETERPLGSVLDAGEGVVVVLVVVVVVVVVVDVDVDEVVVLVTVAAGLGTGEATLIGWVALSIVRRVDIIGLGGEFVLGSTCGVVSMVVAWVLVLAVVGDAVLATVVAVTGLMVMD